ncbi:hypothetical protein F53441_11198 [Fusarium austroafricanum]|uniref:Uncharacterized protein n=1 Tax=Fusarium austroafricanum TaxID=2364996 RepID=A0A8H4NMU9_9HYPO|nr:hypothetical protein F53441_11198 [Fusarium austroafricanum]
MSDAAMTADPSGLGSTAKALGMHSRWTDIATFVQFHAKEETCFRPNQYGSASSGPGWRITESKKGKAQSGQMEHVKSEPDNAVGDRAWAQNLRISRALNIKDCRPLSNAGTVTENLIFRYRIFSQLLISKS